MAILTLKKLPDDIHRDVRRLQLDYDEKGVKKTLEELYIDLIKKGLDQFKADSK